MSAVDLLARINTVDLNDAYLEGTNAPQTVLEGLTVADFNGAITPLELGQLDIFLNHHFGTERFGGLTADQLILRRALVTDPAFRREFFGLYNNDIATLNRPDNSAQIRQSEERLEQVRADITNIEEQVDETFRVRLEDFENDSRTRLDTLRQDVQNVLSGGNVDESVIAAQNLRLTLERDRINDERAALQARITLEKRNRTGNQRNEVNQLQATIRTLNSNNRVDIDNRTAESMLLDVFGVEYGGRINALTTLVGFRSMHEVDNINNNEAEASSRVGIVNNINRVSTTLGNITNGVLRALEGVGDLFQDDSRYLYNDRLRRFSGIINLDSTLLGIQNALQSDNNQFGYNELCEFCVHLRQSMRNISVDAPNELRNSYRNLLRNMEMVRVRYSINRAMEADGADFTTMNNTEVVTAMSSAMQPEAPTPAPEEQQDNPGNSWLQNNFVRTGALGMARWLLERIGRNRSVIISFLLNRFFNRRPPAPDPA